MAGLETRPVCRRAPGRRRPRCWRLGTRGTGRPSRSSGAPPNRVAAVEQQWRAEGANQRRLCEPRLGAGRLPGRRADRHPLGSTWMRADIRGGRRSTGDREAMRDHCGGGSTLRTRAGSRTTRVFAALATTPRLVDAPGFRLSFRRPAVTWRSARPGQPRNTCDGRRRDPMEPGPDDFEHDAARLELAEWAAAMEPVAELLGGSGGRPTRRSSPSGSEDDRLEPSTSCSVAERDGRGRRTHPAFYRRPPDLRVPGRTASTSRRPRPARIRRRARGTGVGRALTAYRDARLGATSTAHSR